MATDPKAAERSARAYRKRKALAMAEMSGAEILDITVVARATDGHYVVMLHDGPPLHLIERSVSNGTPEPVADHVRNDHATPAPTKRLYPPKAMSRAQYETNVKVIREKAWTKTETHEAMHKASPDGLGKQGTQFLALVDALPNGPDWADHFPAYPEEE